MSFAGFQPPTSNYFRMPNAMINILADIDNLAELKVVLYVLRHTWGYREYGGIPKAITIDEFMHGRWKSDGNRMDKGTQLSEQSVRNGLEKAIKDGLLVCEIDTRDKGRIKKAYALKMQDGSPPGSPKKEEVKSVEVKDLDLKEGTGQKGRGQKVIPQTVSSLRSDPKRLDPKTQKAGPRTEKETLERNSRKTPEKDDRYPSPTQKEDGENSEMALNTWHENKNHSHSFALSPDEETLLAWITDQQYQVTITRATSAKIKEQVAALIPHIKTPGDLESLCAFCVRRIKGEDKTVYLGNMVKWINAWAKTRHAEVPDVCTTPKTMDHDAAEAFARSLLGTYPAELLGIDQTYPDNDTIWSTCLRYGPEEEDWLYFASPEHYYNPSPWEQTRIAWAVQYGETLVEGRKVG